MKSNILFSNPMTCAVGSPINPKTDKFGYTYFVAGNSIDSPNLYRNISRLGSSNQKAAKLLSDAIEAHKLGHLNMLVRVNEQRNTLHIDGRQGLLISELSDECKHRIVEILNDLEQL
ncbi:hypothetical protein [Vibrio sp. D431a]|uniref:hypothetical protein n=1 Tax=Vibrio sp. D431a TaxID=2837388 RepID=UPI002553A4EC|nr:hypothetical protein [Vibrio sp. D431a]MDK9789891.1 hypothetical protein [Vibrio sp. D431a]